jgi:hypothetical protein
MILFLPDIIRNTTFEESSRRAFLLTPIGFTLAKMRQMTVFFPHYLGSDSTSGSMSQLLQIHGKWCGNPSGSVTLLSSSYCELLF